MADLEKDEYVDISGTGCSAFHSDTIKIHIDDFWYRNMADIFFGIICKKQNIPMVCIKHTKNWMQYQTGGMAGKQTIYSQKTLFTKLQSQYLNSFFNQSVVQKNTLNSNILQQIKNPVAETIKHTLDILIPTLAHREIIMRKITRKVMSQIERNGLAEKVKVQTYSDEGRLSIGHKRNQLVENSTAEYVMFLDDDDDVHNDYIKDIYDAIVKHKPDCVTFNGTVTFNGANEQQYNFGLQYREYKNEHKVFTRPPGHLCAIRREIALKYKFKELDKTRDRATDVWHCLEMVKDRAIKSAAHIDKPLYHYRKRI